MNEITENKYLLFFEYVNKNGLPILKEKIRFSNLKENIKEDTNLYNWYATQKIPYKINILLDKCEEFKNKYPIAYELVLKDIDKKLSRLTFIEKTEYLLKYIEKNSIPTGRSTIRFSDAFDEVKDTTNMGIWLQSSIKKSKNKLLISVEKYKNVYKESYNKIMPRILREPNTYEERVKLFMTYHNKYEYKDISEELTFNDITKELNDNTKIKRWVNIEIFYNEEKFLNECSKSKDIYPKAYTRIKERIIKKNILKDKEYLEKRILIYLNYLENNDLLELTNRTMFKDLSKNSNDDVIVSMWFQGTLTRNQELLEKLLNKYKDNYPIGYEKLIKKLYGYNSKMSFEEKVLQLIKYLEIENIPTVKDEIVFKDIKKDSKDTTLVGKWINNAIFLYLQQFINEIEKYKDIYPTGYNKIKNKINKSNASKRRERLLLIEQLKNIKIELEQADTKKLTKIK